MAPILPIQPELDPDPLPAQGRVLDKIDVDRFRELSRLATFDPEHFRARVLLPAVDHSKHISFVRHQGAYGCGLNAAAACVDILWSMGWPQDLHPNVSVNRMLWAWRWTLLCLPEDKPCGQRVPGTIPGPNGTQFETEDDFLSAVGFAGEGTELTDSDGVTWPTQVGDVEASHYRLAKHPLNLVPTGDPAQPVVWLKHYPHAVPVNLQALKSWLNEVPVRVGVWGNHFVTLVGYDDAAQKLKFINSWGDCWGDGGFGYIDYGKVDQEIDSAVVYAVQPPAPLPCARIGFRSHRRQDVHLWLSVEGQPYVKRIWPSEQRQDDSRNLSLTVTLPPNFVWPPSPQNRLCLDVYDRGSTWASGGGITEFTVGYQGQFYYSANMQQGSLTGGALPAGAVVLPGDRWSIPVPFAARMLCRLTVP